jgi:hypothetical protein
VVSADDVKRERAQVPCEALGSAPVKAARDAVRESTPGASTRRRESAPLEPSVASSVRRQQQVQHSAIIGIGRDRP